MARIRTIKPEFWQNEELSSISIEAHMLAAALLNIADDEGYFKANPKLIKANCFPLREDSLNIHGMLSELSNIDYIKVYNGTDGKQYGHIVSFLEHQKINRPNKSKIKDLIEFTEGSVSIHGAITDGKEGKGTGKGKERDNSMSFCNDVIEAHEIYNETAKELDLPIAQKLTETRKKKLKARLRDCDGLEGWRYAMEMLRQSPHCQGNNDRGWRADLDFLLRESSFVKLMEGTYTQTKKQNGMMDVFDDIAGGNYDLT